MLLDVVLWSIRTSLSYPLLYRRPSLQSPRCQMESRRHRAHDIPRSIQAGSKFIYVEICRIYSTLSARAQAKLLQISNKSNNEAIKAHNILAL